MNWRRLEDELVRIARKMGHDIDEDHQGDKVIVLTHYDEPHISLTEIARELSEVTGTQ